MPSQLPKEAIEKKAAITKIAKILELEPEIIQKILKETDLEFTNRILLVRDLPQK